MNEHDLRHIIALILDAIEEASRPKKALVMFTGALLGFDESIESLRVLKSQGLQMTGIKTYTAEHLLDQAKIDALGMDEPGLGLVASHDVLIIPTLTVNTAAKVACGIADGLATNLISEFISAGKIVVAASTAADPDSAAKRALFPYLPAAQANLWRTNLNKVRELGVRCCEASDLAVCVSSILSLPTSQVESAPASQDSRTQDRLIAAHHIQPLAAGSVLVVPRDALVTAMAADIARSRFIRIERA